MRAMPRSRLTLVVSISATRCYCSFFFFNDTATTEIYTLSLHDALPIPPGRSTRTYEFSMPLAGHLLAAGGHLHDFGAGLRLVDTKSGKTLVRIRPKRTPDGRVVSMSRQLFGVRGQGPKLRTDRTYRLVVDYDNPTNAPAPHVM